MDGFKAAKGKVLVEGLVKTIQENKGYLSEIDGAIGDGDHGINMNKGFSLAWERMQDEDLGLEGALKTLGQTLLNDIGGSMGPLYGQFFRKMARSLKGKEEVDAAAFEAMLESAYGAIKELGEAKVGDKTLVDTLDPAIGAFKGAVESGKSFSVALDEMVAAAEKGKDSTFDLVAKIGRSARLGERSRGALDAGAVSCFLMLKSMSGSVQQLLGEE
ncbi:MAG: dihydroxyacetone kinase subunit L [Spirochaetaceae bacterium]|nr:dihydroxyacetone kinase subunit L [Spirochaetaceae bacterium]MCF7947600.1 dihydroxyacetone kinase subunit L [Spirochaetia bacterium]MCF7951468.1 dihydroxyacetone kinase subunit L [Spirochaetaceae bacterium]